MLLSSKTVIILAKTVHTLENTTIFADNFSSIALVEYLRDHYKCRYVGTARENRVGNPLITASHELNKKQVGRGTLDYSSTDGILPGKNSPIVSVSYRYRSSLSFRYRFSIVFRNRRAISFWCRYVTILSMVT